MTAPDRVIFASYGNDSVALIQWAHEQGLQGVTVAYSNTGWAAHKWGERVRIGRAWAESLGFQTVELPSIGMHGLVRLKKAWPRGGGGKYQFCTEHLKEAPALAWLDQVDPGKETICMIGVRREESDNRATFPEWTEESEKHGGRQLHAPLVRHREPERDALVLRSPLPVLPHRSKECYPCVNARQGEIAAMDEPAIVKVEEIELEAGTNSKGNERVRRELWAAIYRQAHEQSATRVRPEFCWAEDADRALQQFDRRFSAAGVGEVDRG